MTKSKKSILIVLLSIFCLAVYAGENIKLTLVDKDTFFKYTSSTGDWYFGAYDETGLYTVHLDYLVPRENKFGTFTDTDLDHEYSYIRHGGNNDYVDIQIVEGSQFTFAKDGSYYTLTGTLYGGDGNTYTIEGRFKLPEPKTYNVEGQFITILRYDEEGQDWYLRFKNDDYKITLDLKSNDGKFSGTYTEADALFEGACYITDLHEDDDIPFTTFSISMQQSTEVENPSKGCEITGTATTADGDTYNFHMLKNPPIKPIKEKSVEVNLVKATWPYYNDHGIECSYYELTEKLNPREKWTICCSRLVGEATDEEIDTAMTSRVNTYSGKTQKLDNGTITQTLDAELKNIIVKAQFVMSDSILYTFNFLSPLTTKERLNYTFTDLWVDTSLAEYGSIMLNASNDDCYMSMNLTDAELPGTYDDRNVSIILNISDNKGNDTQITNLAILNAECSFAEDGTPVLNCSFIGSDMNIHTINASFILPEITDTLNLQIANASFYDATEYSNGFNICYNTEDYDMICNLSVLSEDKIAGHYTIDDLDNISYILFTDKNGLQHELRFYSGDFDVTYNGGIITLKGIFQAGNYHVVLAITNADVIPDGIAEIRVKEHTNVNSFLFNTIGQRINSYYRGISIRKGKKYCTFGKD